MDPWISTQPSLSLDLRVGLPATAAVAMVKPKVLVEEDFFHQQPLKKDPEVGHLIKHTCTGDRRPPWLGA